MKQIKMDCYQIFAMILLGLLVSQSAIAVPVTLNYESSDIVYKDPAAFSDFPADYFEIISTYDTDNFTENAPGDYYLHPAGGINYILDASSTGETRNSAAGPGINMLVYNNIFDLSLGEVIDKVVLTTYDYTQRIELEFIGDSDSIASLAIPVQSDYANFSSGTLRENRGLDQYLFFVGNFSTAVPNANSLYLFLLGFIFLNLTLYRKKPVKLDSI